MARDTLRNRIHISNAAGLAALAAEIEALSLDLEAPYGWHLFNDHLGRELNKRSLILTGSVYYTTSPFDAGLRPLLTALTAGTCEDIRDTDGNLILDSDGNPIGECVDNMITDDGDNMITDDGDNIILD
jgi:hypothetical protein